MPAYSTKPLWSKLGLVEGVPLVLPLGLVDVKVCSVTELWSGLKLMVRRENRPGRTNR